MRSRLTMRTEHTGTMRTRLANLLRASTFVVVALAVGSTATATVRNPTHVACVGDSITAGAEASSSNTTYPAVLQTSIGSSTKVMNFGRSGATMLSVGDLPYQKQSEYTGATNFVSGAGASAVVDVIIMLGTNDSKPYNWTTDTGTRAEQFRKDCALLVDHFTQLATHPLVHLALPPHAYANRFQISGTVLDDEILPVLKQVAADKGIPVIDVDTPTTGHPELLSDGVHPNDNGYKLLARVMYDGLLVPTGGTGGSGAGGSGGAGAGGAGGGSGGTTAGGAGGGSTGGSGGVATGGAGGSGGVATGGAGGSGDAGVGGTGGVRATGGMLANGGSVGGGTIATGGVSSSGGVSHTGGTSTPGGSVATGGSRTGGGDPGTANSGSSNGCSCALAQPDQGRRGATWPMLLVLGATALVRRRHQARKPIHHREDEDPSALSGEFMKHRTSLLFVCMALWILGSACSSTTTGGSGGSPSVGGSNGLGGNPSSGGVGAGGSSVNTASGGSTAGGVAGTGFGGGSAGSGGSATGGATASGGSNGGADGGVIDSGSGGGSDGSADNGAGGSFSGSGGAGGNGEATESMHFYGRWNRLADRAITVNSGSHVAARFSGTGISAKFDTTLNKTPNPTLAWQIDKNAWQEGELAKTVVLGSGLSTGTHEVTLMVRGLDQGQSRWSPPLISSITFLGFDVSGGGALQPSLRPARPKLEILGDSITEGASLWSSYNGQNTVCWLADGLHSYGTQTAQLLGAELRQVGFAAQGLRSKGNGGVPFANDTFNWIYEDVPRDSWQPDMVVVNQGTNDWMVAGSSEVFRPAYADFLATIRAGYPGAKIVALRPFNGGHAGDIQAEVEVRKAAGDKRVYYVNTDGWLGNGDYTDGVHPNQQGSQKAASALVAAIKLIGLP